MTCAEARPVLGAFVDLELSATEAAAAAAHVAQCTACAAEVAALTAIGAAVRRALPALQAPDVLRGRIQQALAAEPAASPDSQTPRSWKARWWTRAAAAVLLIAVGSVGTLLVTPRRTGMADSESAALVDRHVRALMAQHPIEVTSSERHTVKPWFAGRVDFSPPVPALDSLGILLIGGRVDTVETAPAAVLAYRKRLHLVGVFVRPDGSGSVEPLMGESRGYNVVRWQERGFRFAAVSDLNAAELRAFAEAFRLGAR